MTDVMHHQTSSEMKSYNFHQKTHISYKVDKIDKIFKPGIYKQTNEFVKSIKKPNKKLMNISHGYNLMKILTIWSEIFEWKIKSKTKNY